MILDKDNSKIMILKEIGHIFNVIRPMINQLESIAMGKIRRSPWGITKTKELYDQKVDKSKYNIPEIIETINFTDRCLCDEVI